MATLPNNNQIEHLEFVQTLRPSDVSSMYLAKHAEENIKANCDNALTKFIREKYGNVTRNDYKQMSNKIIHVEYDGETIKYRYVLDYYRPEITTCSSTISTENDYSAYIYPSCSTTTSIQYSAYRPYVDYEMDYHGASWWKEPVINPASKIRDIIQSRQAPILIVPNRKPLIVAPDIREIRARDTLRRIIGDDAFKRFIKNAFIHVRGKSGKYYQIFTGHNMTNVFDNGQHVERLCVVLKGDFAPTDSLLMRYLIILNDEEEFRKLAISHTVYKTNHRNVQNIDTRPLTEIFKSLKAA